MSSPDADGQLQISKKMLLVCDVTGKVQAVTSRAASDTLTGVSIVGRDFAQIFGLDSTINRWFTERIQEARGQYQYSAETSLENGHGKVFVRLESLTRDGEPYGFALQLRPLVQPETPSTLVNGDSIISRRQWHEIKNHVGALKLYATFLKRKMSEGDERSIVEKIFNGVNALIGYLERIQRGDVK
jgi:hypothetical protein